MSCFVTRPRMQFEIIILVVFGLWLTALTVFCLSAYKSFQRLTSNVKEGNLLTILEKVLTEEQAQSSVIKALQSEIKKIVAKDTFHIQKLGVVRFNPFKELGGEHSFTIALIDGNNNGILLTGLHARERTRMYVKPVKNGKSDLELSEEEKKALRLTEK